MNIKPNTFIEVISKSKIRYTGTLQTINADTFTLTNVRSFGTEERECLHPVECSDNTYSIMTFKVANIISYKTDKWKVLNKNSYGQFLDVQIPEYDYEFEEQTKEVIDVEALKEGSKKFYDKEKSFYDNFNR